jgi:hypothetical protein
MSYFYAKVRAKLQLPKLKALFPDYRGRTVVLTEGETVRISDYWDEGHRAYPAVVYLEGMKRVYAWPDEDFTLQTQGNPYHARMGTLTMRPGRALVEHVYSGTRQYLRVTLHPSEDRGTWI